MLIKMSTDESLIRAVHSVDDGAFAQLTTKGWSETKEGTCTRRRNELKRIVGGNNGN
ncbi:MAG: hypothetical protein ABR903_00825 [Thermodesulfovibrionales bacterium]|jgi:hypothetical protein